MIEKLPVPKLIITGNGSVKVDSCVPWQLQSLNTTIKPILTRNAPSCLSIGSFCMEDDFSFIWLNKCKPSLVHNDGTWTEFDLSLRTPVLKGSGGPKVPSAELSLIHI